MKPNDEKQLLKKAFSENLMAEFSDIPEAGEEHRFSEGFIIKMAETVKREKSHGFGFGTPLVRRAAAAAVLLITVALTVVISRSIPLTAPKTDKKDGSKTPQDVISSQGQVSSSDKTDSSDKKPSKGEETPEKDDPKPHNNKPTDTPADKPQSDGNQETQKPQEVEIYEPDTLSDAETNTELYDIRNYNSSGHDIFVVSGEGKNAIVTSDEVHARWRDLISSMDDSEKGGFTVRTGSLEIDYEAVMLDDYAFKDKLEQLKGDLMTDPSDTVMTKRGFKPSNVAEALGDASLANLNTEPGMHDTESSVPNTSEGSDTELNEALQDDPEETVNTPRLFKIKKHTGVKYLILEYASHSYLLRAEKIVDFTDEASTYITPETVFGELYGCRESTKFVSATLLDADGSAKKSIKGKKKLNRLFSALDLAPKEDDQPIKASIPNEGGIKLLIEIKNSSPVMITFYPEAGIMVDEYGHATMLRQAGTEYIIKIFKIK